MPVDGFIRKNADCEITIEPRRKKKDLFLETDLGIGKIFVEFDNEEEAAEAWSVRVYNVRRWMDVNLEQIS